MFASSRIRGLICPALALAALVLALPGCEEDTKPKITRLSATPRCNVIETVTEPRIDANTGLPIWCYPPDTPPLEAPTDSFICTDAIGTWMEVTFFARATSGNEKSEPTGANSPLEWNWDFGDGGTAKNVVGPIHRYTEPGTHTVTLTVEDDDGDKDTATIDVIVGEAYSDLDILQIDFVPDSELLFSTIPGSVAVDLSQAWGSQREPSVMEMRLDGSLRTSCEISGLFEQYLWNWTVIDPSGPDTTRVANLDPAIIGYAPALLDVQTRVHVMETATGIARYFPPEKLEDEFGEPLDVPVPVYARVLNPIALRVGYSVPRTVLPEEVDRIELEGYLLNGAKELSFELEWNAEACSLRTVTFDPAITTGFSTSHTIEDGRLTVSLTNASGYAGAELDTKIADLDFWPRAVEPGLYPIRFRWASATRPDPVDEDEITFAPNVTTVDGGINLDTDCDGDGFADSFQAEFFPAQFDCNGNGVHDRCDILNGTSEDSNENLVPDECEG